MSIEAESARNIEGKKVLYKNNFEQLFTKENILKEETYIENYNIYKNRRKIQKT